MAPALPQRCSAEAISVRASGEFGKESQLALFKSWNVIQDVLVLFLVKCLNPQNETGIHNVQLELR